MVGRVFGVREMVVGAEVVGLAPGDLGDAGVRAELYGLWLKFGLLVFRGVASVEEHLALSRCFGELEVHPLPEVRWEENPLLIELGGSKTAPAYVYDGGDVRVNRLPWHRDTAYTPTICKGAMLWMLETPSVEGETLFADTALAYDALPGDVKERLEGLEYKATVRMTPLEQTRPGALWREVRKATVEEDPQVAAPRKGSFDRAAAAARYPSVIHPAVLVHPESGRKCIFLSPTYVDYFIGLEQSESDELLAYLMDHMTQSRFVYKHSWTVNDALTWDNRRFMHAALGHPVGEPRRALRTTLATQFRPGRYFDESVTGEVAALVD